MYCSGLTGMMEATKVWKILALWVLLCYYYWYHCIIFLDHSGYIACSSVWIFLFSD